MNDNNDYIERRRHKRFQVKKGVSVVLLTNPMRLCQIINISIDGVAFSFSGKGVQLSKIKELDLYVIGFGFYLGRTRFDNVYQYEINGEFPMNNSPVKRFGVKFSEMSDAKRVKLEKFLQDYTTTEV